MAAMNESAFELSEEGFAGGRVLVLADRRCGSSCRIALRGATLLSFRTPGTDGQPFDVVDGYDDAETFQRLAGSRSAIMMPFTNRIASGRYGFAGREHVLPERRSDGNAMHGLVRAVDWPMADCDLTEGWVLLRTDALAVGDVAGYPFHIECFVRFRLAGNTLEVALSAANTGERAAPLAMGWHPYLSVPSGNLDGCRLEVPADQYVITDDRLLPLVGDRAYGAVARGDCDYRGRRPVGQLDTCFTALRADTDGWVRTRLEDRDSDYQVTVGQRRGAMHVYTPAAEHGRRRRLALEPTEFIPDAFNRPECLDALGLPAGDTRSFVSYIEARFR